MVKVIDEVTHTLGSPPKKATPPPLNLNTNVTKSQKIKEGIMDAIKIGVPGN